jgi:hypothetical protein
MDIGRLRKSIFAEGGFFWNFTGFQQLTRENWQKA